MRRGSLLDERLRALAEVISEGFMQIRDGCLTMSNTPLAKAAGRGGVSLRGMKVSDLFLETEEGLPGPQGPGVMECTLRTSDGRDREVVCRRVWSDASCEDWLVDDVTDRRDVERELLRTGRDLARSNRELEAVKDQLRSERTEREELLSVVSHELRTPLTVVNGYIRLLLSEDAGALNEDQKRFLEESRKSSQRLTSFVSNILDAARVTRQAEILEITSAPIGPVIEGVAEMLQPLFNEKSLCLTLDLETDAEVRFDPVRVEQVLTNLLANALKHVPPGGRVDVTLREYERSSDQRSFVEIAVEDDGPGVATGDRERVFEPYVQLGEREQRDGLGLGLAICRRLVEAHGGEIRLCTPPSGGARFAFTLPVAEAAQAKHEES
jgi:signal transduction histidine kinase